MARVGRTFIRLRDNVDASEIVAVLLGVAFSGKLAR